jgi:hypothetical protein
MVIVMLTLYLKGSYYGQEDLGAKAAGPVG